MFHLMAFLMLLLSVLGWRQLLRKPRTRCRCKPLGVRVSLTACLLDAGSLLILLQRPEVGAQWVPWMTLFGCVGINALLMIAVRCQLGIVMTVPTIQLRMK